MATPRKLYGYVDNQELHRALEANRHARRAMDRLLARLDSRRVRGIGWMYPLLTSLAHHLGQELEALVEMKKIRNQCLNEEAQADE